MIYHHDESRPYACTAAKATFWRYFWLYAVAIGTLLAVGSAYRLDDTAADELVATSADYAAGVEEGRRQEREARVLAVRAAFTHGLDEAAERGCKVAAK